MGVRGSVDEEELMGRLVRNTMIPDAIKAMLRMTIKDVRAVRLIVGGKGRWRSIDGCLKPFAEK